MLHIGDEKVESFEILMTKFFGYLIQKNILNS